MSLLVIGLSHHTAPLAVLEALSERPDRAEAIAASVLGSATATEAVVLSTCNRLEVYASVPAFHPAVAAIGEALALAAGIEEPDGARRVAELPPGDPADALAARAEALADHLYVRYDDAAVAHAFTVACGLDSMAVGEAQILGQMRDSLAGAQGRGQVGESLNALFQGALRVGKRAHTETDIDQHSVSLVQIALEEAAAVLGPLDDVSAAVVGAGGMSGLAAATARRQGVDSLTIVNRTPERAERLAAATSGVARSVVRAVRRPRRERPRHHLHRRRRTRHHRRDARRERGPPRRSAPGRRRPRAPARRRARRLLAARRAGCRRSSTSSRWGCCSRAAPTRRRSCGCASSSPARSPTT